MITHSSAPSLFGRWRDPYTTDWHILITDGHGHHAKFLLSTLDQALADGSISALEDSYLNLLSMDIPPTFDTLARCHADALAAIAAEVR